MSGVDQHDANARWKPWLSLLGRIFNGDAQLIDYLQKVIGYSLTGIVTEKALFVLHGGGYNGKTTLLEAVRSVMGDYAGVIDIDALISLWLRVGRRTPIWNLVYV